MRRLRKIVAVALVMIMLMTMQQGSFIALADETVKAQDEKDKIELPDYIPEDSEKRNQHVKERTDLESEYLSVYENEDGSLTVYSFMEPVKYKDENGELKDYNSELKEVKDSDKKDDGYAYEITSSDVTIMMPEDIATDKSLTMEYDKYKIEFKPLTDLSEGKEEDYEVDKKYKAKEEKNSDKKVEGLEYLSSDSSDITYKYYTLNTGIKEEIILEEKPETNIIQFEYKLKNLIPEQSEDGAIFFLDAETEEIVGLIEPLFMYDSFTGEQTEEDGHYSEDIQLSIEQDKNNKNRYIFTITLDKEFLEDEDTVYPVIIDPTQTLTLNTHNTEIKDTFITSKYSTSQKYYNYTTLRLGYSTSWKKARALIQPIIPSGTIYDSYDIVSAKYKALNVTSYTSTAYVDIHRITHSWSHTSVCWSNQPTRDSAIQATRIINGYEWATWDITNMVENWAKYANDSSQGYPNYGFMVKERYENGSRFRSITAANANSSSYLVIEYETSDLEAPDNVASLSVSSDADTNNNGKAKIDFSWPETTDNPSWNNDGVKEYELTLTDSAGNYYQADGTMVGSSTPENYTPEIVSHDGTTSTYTKEFVNLPDNTTYNCKIRACDNASTANWSGYTYSGDIVIGDIEEVTVSVGTTDWTTDTTPTISWTGIADTDSVYYSVDSGTWTDSGLLGSAGSGDLPALTQDGQYQIKIKGVDSGGVSGAESPEVTYKLDITNPTAEITSPQNGAIIAESVDIIGTISDTSSGIASWTLEYGEGSTPTTWNTITTGTTEIAQGATITTWDTSQLGVGDYIIKLTSTDNAGLSSAESTVSISKPVAIILTTPTNISAVADVNYMATVDWEDGINPVGTTYEIYRDTTDSFTPDSATNMIAEDVSTTYWNDYTVETGTSYYYKVIAEYDYGDGTREISNPTDASNQVTITAASEVGEMLGLQDFWTYSSFSAGNGAGYINAANGNLVYSSTDSVFLGMMLAMVMRRTYNSQSDVKTALGYGWDFSYNTCLYKEYDTGEGDIDLILKDGDGSLHYFDYDSTASSITSYTTPDGIFMELSYNETTDEYTIERNDYVTYVFDGDLNLKKLSEINGNYLQFNYDQSDRLISIENYDNSDNSINIAYLYYYQDSDSGASYYDSDSTHDGLLARMVDPAGRVYKYEYVSGAAYLEKAYLDIAGTSNDYEEEYTYASGTYSLASITDANDNTTTITYETGSKVDVVTYPDPDSSVTGDELSLSLSYGTGTTTISDNWNHSSVYAYDSYGCVTSTTNTLGDATTYTYNSDYQVTGVSYQNYVGSSTSLSTISTTITYDSNNNISTITDADGNTSTYTYDTTFVNKVKTITVPMDSSTDAVTTNVYYANGNLKYTTDAEGNVTEYTYTNEGLISTIISHVGGTASTLGSKTYYTYYSNGWLNEIRQGSKNDSTLSLMSKVVQYDSQGNATIAQDAMGNRTKVEYDTLGLPTKSYLADKDTQETTQDWSNNEYTTAAYDLKGNVTSTTDVKGNITNYTYDDMDRLTTTTQVVSTGNIVNTVEYSNYTYNSTTCLKMIYTDPEGGITIEYYDELGRVRKTAISDGTTPLTRAIYEYDKAGNVVSSKDLINSSETEYREITYEYDELNRQTATKTYNDSSELISTTTTYDYVGNTKTVTDPDGYVTYYYYDGIGRLTRVKAGGYNTYYSYDNITEYDGTYYLMNKITDAKGHVKETYLDDYGNAVVEINQGDTSTTDNMVVEHTFNLDGTVSTTTQADGQVDYYTYNNWGQVTLTRYSSSTSTNNQTAYTYNDHGQMSSMTDRRSNSLSGGIDEVTTSWTYDALGQTTSQTQDGVTIQYDYDKNGNITELQQPTDGDLTNTEVTSYVYDGYGQLESIYQNNEKVTDYVYNSKGQLEETIDYLKFDESNTTTTMTTEYTYTGLGEVSQMKYIDDTSNSTLEKYTYTYNKRGYIETETLMNTYDGTTTQTKTHVYDSLGRVKETTASDDIDDVIKYSYDSTGNRYQEKYYVNGVSCNKILTYYYNEFDQLTEVTMVGSTNAQSIQKYEYDDRGALISSEERLYNGIYWYDDDDDPSTPDDWAYVYSSWPPWYETTYTYDKAGNLQKTVEEKSGDITETTGHFYNGMGQRIRREEDYVITKYIYTGSTVLFTTDDNNDKITENILTPSGQAVASQRFDGSYDGNYYFYNQDIRNSTTAIVDESYDAKKYYVYGSFGKATEKGSSSFINDITFTGAVSEGDGIYYMNARFYDSNTGRFLTQDTYTGNMYEPMSQNLYTYCGNNPINYVDPTGHNRKGNNEDGVNPFFFKGYLPKITPDGIEEPLYSWSDETDEELTKHLYRTYDYYNMHYGTGTYYEDIALSAVVFGGTEQGKTVVINLDEGWIALYGHGGLEVGLGLSPVDVKVSTGEVYGVNTPEDYLGGFLQTQGSIIAQAEGATNTGEEYGKITQNGYGFITNISISGGWSTYEAIKALNVNIVEYDDYTVIDYSDYIWNQ